MGQRVSLAVLPDLGGSLGLPGGGRQADPEHRARETLERAECQAQLVMEAARQKAAAVVAEGHREGLLQGRAEGLRDGQARGAALVRCVEEAADRLHGLEAAWCGRAEQVVIELAVALAERILQTAVAEVPSHVRRTVAAALAAVPMQGDVTLRVHPDLVETVKSSLDAAPETLTGSRLRVVGDAGIGLGGCTVEGPGVLVDATYAAQLAEARRRLEEAT